MQLSNLLAAVQCMKWRASVNVHIKHQNGKNLSDLCDLWLLVPDWLIWVFQKLLAFSHTRVSWVYTEWCDKQKTFSSERGLRRIAGLVHADRKSTISSLYNCDEQISMPERTTRRTLRRTEYSRIAEDRVALLSIKNKNLRQQWTHTKRTDENWEKFAWHFPWVKTPGNQQFLGKKSSNQELQHDSKWFLKKKKKLKCLHWIHFFK